MKRLTTLIAVFALLAFTAIQLRGQTSMDYNIMIEDLEFQPGVTIDININVYVNENATNWANHGKIFAIEGMAHTANCWKPFAEKLFERSNPELEINEFFAIDMPGRGGSGLPEGWNSLSNDEFKLADMYLEDYVSVIRQSIHYLIDEHNVRPNTIMGHSLGGLEVILFQDMLVKEGTNMRKELGIKNAILLAPAIPAPLTWSFLGIGSAQLIPFAWDSPEYGWILDIPFYLWPWNFFTNTCCYFPPGNPYGYTPSMVPGAPNAATVLANGYNSIEAGPLLFHMAGLPITILDPNTHHPTRPRVTAEEGIFTLRHGVELTIIADEFDKMMHPDEEMALYEYLTNNKHGNGLHVVEGEETCHDTHISDPHAVVALLNKPGFFKSLTKKEDGPAIASTLSIIPNPANDNVNINFMLDEDACVGLGIYDSRGALVMSSAEAAYDAGDHRISLDIGSLPPGMYFCKLQNNGGTIVKKLIIQ